MRSLLSRRYRALVATMSLALVSGCQPGPDAAPADDASDEASANPQGVDADATRAANVADGAFVVSRPLADVTALWATATVQAPPRARSVVSAPLAGRVLRVLVREGDRVDPGAPLLDVVLPDLARHAGQRERARTRLATLRPRLAQLRALARSGVARAADLAAVELDVGEAAADQQLAEALLRSSGYGPDDAPTLLARGGRVTLRARRAGLVVHVPESVAPGAPFGEQDHLAALAHEDSARVLAHLAPALLDVDWAGFLLITPAGDVPLTLMSAAPAVDARDGTRPTWLDANPGANDVATLPIGARGWVRPVAASPTWVVPAAALRGGKDASTFVTARQDGQLRPITITHLATVGGLAIITGPETPRTVQLPGAAAAPDAPPEAAR